MTKLQESVIALNTNYIEPQLFRCETIIINNFARSSLSELQNSNLRPKSLNCRGQESSQKNILAHSWSDSSFYVDVRYVHQSAGNVSAQGISEYPRVSFFIYRDSNTHFDFILTKMSRGQSHFSRIYT